MELSELLKELREKLDPLEYAAVMCKYFGEGSEDWQRIQMIGVDKYIILADDDLVEFLAARGLKKIRETNEEMAEESKNGYGAY